MAKYAGLDQLLQHEQEARSYFDALPDYVRSSIEERKQSVNSFESLRDYAENLLRGDD